jgi:hypothetical protein
VWLRDLVFETFTVFNCFKFKMNCISTHVKCRSTLICELKFSFSHKRGICNVTSNNCKDIKVKIS